MISPIPLSLSPYNFPEYLSFAIAELSLPILHLFLYIFQLLLAVILHNKSHLCKGGVVAGV